MTPGEPTRRGSRVASALTLFAGATLLGPALPALVFVAMAEIGGRLEGPHTRPALPFLATTSAALSFAFFRGGGITAAISGAALALIVLRRGAIGVISVSLVVAIAAATVGAWSARHGPRHEAVFLVLAFMIVSVFTANVFYHVAILLRMWSRE